MGRIVTAVMGNAEERVRPHEERLVLPTEGTVLPETARTRFYPALDGLRTVAIAMVMGVHALEKRFPFGWMGVQLFFVLSGFLITGILFDTKSKPRRLRTFYIRRALRIFPLYYAFLLVMWLSAVMRHVPVPRITALWLLYLQNFYWLALGHFHPAMPVDVDVLGIGTIAHLWSLAVEEQFYLIWPVVVFAVKDRMRLMQICWAIIAARVALAIYWQMHLSTTLLDGGLIYRMLPTQSDGFAMGGLLALWFRGAPSAWAERKAGRVAAISLAAFLGVLLLVSRLPHLDGRAFFDYRSAFMSTAGLTLANAVSLALVFAATQQGSWVYRICNLGWMRSLGKVSYGIYVFHLVVQVSVQEGVLGWLTRRGLQRAAGGLELVVECCVTALMAYASFYGFERPFLLLKNRFTYVRGARERERAAHPA